MSIRSLPLGLVMDYADFALDLQAQALVDGDQVLADNAFAQFAALDDEIERRVAETIPPGEPDPRFIPL